MYKQCVRCHLEFAIPAWSPWAAGDMDILERAQKRAINLNTGLRGRSYEEKLEELGLTTLRERRMKFDLVETYEINNGIDRVDPAIWFNFVGQPTHMATRNTTYSKKLVSSRARTEVRKNFFSTRQGSLNMEYTTNRCQRIQKPDHLQNQVERD